MEEKILKKGELKNSVPYLVISLIVIFVACLAYDFLVFQNDYNYDLSRGRDASFGDSFRYAFGFANGANLAIYPALIILIVVAFVIYSRWRKVKITVTDKRVYGINSVGKRVDLPLDSITAVGTSLFSGLSVTTASGAIKFVLLKNRNELHECISKLLIDRQGRTVASNTTITQEALSNADELKKYKDLLEQGIITQDEYDAKKKQLLGL